MCCTMTSPEQNILNSKARYSIASLRLLLCGPSRARNTKHDAGRRVSRHLIQALTKSRRGLNKWADATHEKPVFPAGHCAGHKNASGADND